MQNSRQTIVIALGGSLLVPDKVDTGFIRQLRTIVEQLVIDGYQVVLVVGGGKTSRYYCKAASEFLHISHEDYDWLGIKAIALNAELVKQIFSDQETYPRVVDPFNIPNDIDHNIVIVGASEPGHSSDYNAVKIAEALQGTKIINFSNIDYVYDKDPKEFSDAKKLSKLSWSEYLDLIPQDWVPNMSSPFDPIASRKAQDLGIELAVIGPSIENLESYINGDPFEGTLIQ